MKIWYFESLKEQLNGQMTQIEKNIKDYKIEAECAKKYINVLSNVGKVKSNDFFDKTHGYYVAIVQGFFRKYYYLRGRAFSFLIDENIEFKKYTKT